VSFAASVQLMALPELLTVDEVAERSRFSTKTVRRAIRRGELRASKPCGRWRIRPCDFEDWVERATYIVDEAAVAPQLAPVPPRGSGGALRRIEREVSA